MHDPYAENALALLDEGAPPPVFERASAGGERSFNVNGRSPDCAVFRAVIPRLLALAAFEMLLAETVTSADARGTSR